MKYLQQNMVGLWFGE